MKRADRERLITASANSHTLMFVSKSVDKYRDTAPREDVWAASCSCGIWALGETTRTAGRAQHQEHLERMGLIK